MRDSDKSEAGHPVWLTQYVLPTGNITCWVRSGLIFSANNLAVLDTHSQLPTILHVAITRIHLKFLIHQSQETFLIYPCAYCLLYLTVVPCSVWDSEGTDTFITQEGYIGT